MHVSCSVWMYVCTCSRQFIVLTQVYGPCWLGVWAYSSASTAGVSDAVVCHVRIQVKDMQALLTEKLHMSSNLTIAEGGKRLPQGAAQEEAASGSEGGERVTGVPSFDLPATDSPFWDGSSVAVCPFSAVHWRCTMYPLAELCGETGTHIKGRGSYVVKISEEGKIAAVVVNCRSARACRVVYVSLESEKAIAVPVYDLTQPADTGRLVHRHNIRILYPLHMGSFTQVRPTSTPG